VPDPQKHANDRNWLESLLQKIPGFRGYLDKQYRRESDQLTRKWMADRLERSKPAINDYSLRLTEAGKLAELAPCEKLRSRLDKVIGGYSGMFDFVKVREDRLDAVYRHDASLMEVVEKVATQIETLKHSQEDSSLVVPTLIDLIDDLDRQFDQRADLLNGLED
jgi:hypothetical protein